MMDDLLVEQAIHTLTKSVVTQIVWNRAIIYIIPQCSPMSFPQSLLINIGIPIIFGK
jgi:hypothetical protein